MVGNPVRPSLFEQDREAVRAAMGLGDETLIVSFGGSLGARPINEVVAQLAAWEKENPGRRIRHIHATGKAGAAPFARMMQEQHVQPDENFEVREYIEDMPALLAAADLVISRSGALTLAELEAVGRASILIPSPYVAENHQYYNALELQKAGAAIVLEEKDLTAARLIELIDGLCAEPGKLRVMGQMAKRLAEPHSLDKITEKLLEIAG